MSETVASFPLCWPQGKPRSKDRQSGSKFGDVTVFQALQKLQKELNVLDADDVIISTSIELRRDGLPYSRPPVDGDPGVAVYFKWRKKDYVIACDQYAYVEYNLRGVALVLEAMRAIERHGSTGLLEQAFTGFAALPSKKSWHEVLGLPPDASPEVIKARYRSLAKSNHPDQGGDESRMAEINAAYSDALRGEK